MTEPQQRVKPGDRVTIKMMSLENIREVLLTTDSGVVVRGNGRTEAGACVRFWPWSQVILPEPPKAKPGVVYRSNFDSLRIGTASGRLAAYCWFPSYPDKREIDFTSEWTGVPDWRVSPQTSQR